MKALKLAAICFLLTCLVWFICSLCPGFKVPQVRSIMGYSDWCHDPVEKLPWLHEQPLAKVVAELGQPSQQLEYTMGNDPGGEFRVGLYNTYPPNDPKTRDVQIKELQWHRSRYHIAVWMHFVNGEWIVLNTLRWKEGVEF